ncbi:MAG: MmcQ/YjbR family DNA-binding protein [Bacteroidota bacterium]
MVSVEYFITLALTFQSVDQQPHFERQSFRINKKIFATLDPKAGTVVIKLTAVEQSVFGAYDQSIIYPVNGAWGKQGWTIVELAKVKKEVLKDALTKSYRNVAPKKLSEKI